MNVFQKFLQVQFNFVSLLPQKSIVVFVTFIFFVLNLTILTGGWRDWQVSSRLIHCSLMQNRNDLWRLYDALFWWKLSVTYIHHLGYLSGWFEGLHFLQNCRVVPHNSCCFLIAKMATHGFYVMMKFNNEQNCTNLPYLLIME